MDSYKRNVIKAGQIIDSGKSVPLSGVAGKAPLAADRAGQTPGRPADDRKAVGEKVIQLTQSQINKREQDAYQKGHADGLKAQSRDIAAKLEVLSAVAKTIPQIKKDILEKGEQQMVKLAFAIAEKILLQEVVTRKDVMAGVLQGALKNINDTEGIKVHLHPQDFRYMMEVKKDFFQSFDGIRNMVFEEDSSVQRGGVVVETMFGEVDARLETQLKEIKAAMLPTKQ
jgi:flagellar assembly protein FliH